MPLNLRCTAILVQPHAVDDDDNDDDDVDDDDEDEDEDVDDDVPDDYPKPGGQRGFLDLTKEIPDNPNESLEDLEPRSRFEGGLPMSHPDQPPDQSFEPPDVPYDPQEEEYEAEDLLNPQRLPEDLQMIENKSDGWQVRAGYGPTLLKSNPKNFVWSQLFFLNRNFGPHGSNCSMDGLKLRT